MTSTDVRPVDQLIKCLDAGYPRADMRHSFWLGNGLIECRATSAGYLLLLIGFWVASNRRHLGHGAAMLDTLTGLADRLQVEIRTWADPYDADRESKATLMKAKELERWYARWGFVPYRKGGKRLVRVPRAGGWAE